MVRNSVVCGIIVPQYVNLHIYDYAFYTTITFHIKESAVELIKEACANTTVYGGSMYVFSKINSRGKLLYYVSIRREYNDLSKINYACHTQADSDRRYLMVKMREAEICLKRREINDLF